MKKLLQNRSNIFQNIELYRYLVEFLVVLSIKWLLLSNLLKPFDERPKTYKINFNILIWRSLFFTNYLVSQLPSVAMIVVKPGKHRSLHFSTVKYVFSVRKSLLGLAPWNLTETVWPILYVLLASVMTLPKNNDGLSIIFVGTKFIVSNWAST